MKDASKKPTLLRVANVSVSIQKVQVLRSFSVDVGRGQMIGIVGRNGAGKTTLMRAIIGLLAYEGGDIEVQGIDIKNLAVYQRARMGIGYMPEERGLIGPLSVDENLRLPGWAAGMPDLESRLERVLDLIPELRGFLHVKALSLSGGQQKLAALARAIVGGERLLLLDEPFEGVSPALSQRLIQVIGEARELGLSILIAQSEAKHSFDVMDHIYYIDRGANVEREVDAVSRSPDRRLP